MHVLLFHLNMHTVVMYPLRLLFYVIVLSVQNIYIYKIKIKEYKKKERAAYKNATTFFYYLSLNLCRYTVRTLQSMELWYYHQHVKSGLDRCIIACNKKIMGLRKHVAVLRLNILQFKSEKSSWGNRWFVYIFALEAFSFLYYKLTEWNFFINVSRH